jgi:hypothetical protein
MEASNRSILGKEAPKVRYSNSESVREQVGFLRRQFLQDGDLPFTDILTPEVITPALAAVGVWLDRVFSPLVTLWVFLGQVLSADHSCRAAVARLIAHRLSRGQRPCSAETGAYCQARQRLPESFFADVACSVGRRLEDQADRRWLWKGRRVYLFDGTTVTMPDTRENQKAYPQVYNERPAPAWPQRGHSVATAGDIDPPAACPSAIRRWPQVKGGGIYNAGTLGVNLTCNISDDSCVGAGGAGGGIYNYGPRQKICNTYLPSGWCWQTTEGCRKQSTQPTKFGSGRSMPCRRACQSPKSPKPTRSTVLLFTAGSLDTATWVARRDWHAFTAVVVPANSRRCPRSSGGL